MARKISEREKIAKKFGCVESSGYWYRFPTILDARDFNNSVYVELGMMGSIHKMSNSVFFKTAD